MENNKQYIALAITIATLAIGGYINTLYNEVQKTRKRVAIVADTNKDGTTSIDEWKVVYRELMIQFDELNPRPLGFGELESFLSKHK